MTRAVLAAGSAAIVLLTGAGCGHDEKQELRELVRFKAVPGPGQKLTSEDLDRTVALLEERLRKLRLDGRVRTQRTAVLVVDVPVDARLQDPKAAAALLGETGLLELYDFEPNLTGPSVSGVARVPVAKPSLYALLSDPATRSLARRAAPSRWYALRGRRFAVPHNTVVVSCDVERGHCLSARSLTTREGFYLFRNTPELTGRDLRRSATRAALDPSAGQPVVVLQFTERGRRTFHEITRREAERGALVCAGRRDAAAVPACAQHLAIVLDHEILTAPYVDFVRNPDGIPGDNGAQIDIGPGGSFADAKRLAIALQTGALPVRLVRLR